MFGGDCRCSCGVCIDSIDLDLIEKLESSCRCIILCFI